jgi:hypothetical protein
LSYFQKINTALTKADTFLLENALPSKTTFTLAIVAYALSLGDNTHPQFRSIASALKKEALVKGRTHSTQLHSKSFLSSWSSNSEKRVACKVE